MFVRAVEIKLQGDFKLTSMRVNLKNWAFLMPKHKKIYALMYYVDLLD